MVLNNIIYEALPYVYSLSGISALLLSGEAIGGTSGVLLVSAAMLVFHMRLEYRAQMLRETEIELATVRMQKQRAGQA